MIIYNINIKMVETFKKIEGFENYSVSDHGNARNNTTGRILKPGCDTCGYFQVGLRKNEKTHLKSIHRLIAKAFLLNPENQKCVDHIDNNKKNNKLTNLRFATSRENNQNASLSSKNTSGTKGVSWNKKAMKWTAQIKINGK